MSKTFIIAEMSANHCGDKEIAKRIISAAKEVGADAVKIQTYTADTLTLNCHTDDFMIKGKDNLWNGEYFYDLYKRAYTPWEWQPELKKYADEIEIPLFSTPFDFTAVDFLEKMDVPMYKIASFEAFDFPLIKYTAQKGKPMIISVGISSLEEMQEAINTCKKAGNKNITLLKCTSAYPAKMENMNLLTIKDMIERFGPQGVKIGLSDHSMSIIPPVTAVALGATVIEKHFTLDRSLGGADCGFSLNKQEFADMVKAVRDTEKALGRVDYTVDAYNRGGGRSLYVSKDIKRGELFTPENLRSVRPANGLHPRYYEEILGKKANCDLSFGTAMRLEYIDNNCTEKK
jgi:N-acetylneuraminate synthase/pseudaminic acid synthase